MAALRLQFTKSKRRLVHPADSFVSKVMPSQILHFCRSARLGEAGVDWD
jgi:hypothetical protein